MSDSKAYAVLAFLGILIAASTLLTGWMRRYALNRDLMDVPNERSSHVAPTPRGGGSAIVAVAFAGLLIAGLAAWLSLSAVLTMIAGGALVAGVGYLDDRGHVAAHWRFLIHLVAAFVVVTFVDGVVPLPFLPAQEALGWVSAIAGVLWIAWSLNLFNFMDGIDGIAAVESVSVSFGGAMILWSVGQTQLALTAAIVGCASLGFLVWNWPPARIFMGDVGSGFLGFVLATLALMVSAFDTRLFWIWPILMGVFIVDASVTLLRRLLRGEKIYEAHRIHAYQHAARRCGEHKPVTLTVAAINLLWLLPIAWIVSHRPDLGWQMTLLAWAPLLAVSLVLGAGRPEADESRRQSE